MANQLQELEMQFDPNTIEHLGIQMYSTLPPVIGELISNSYDADATHVKVQLFDETEKKIVISDNGHGMEYDHLNSKFLKIGRNRRIESTGQKSESGNRYVIGKKGIGKLSFFGIATRVKVETIRGGKKNTFILDWEKLKEDGKRNQNYKPERIDINTPSSEPAGTTITLTNIKRKTGFSPDDIAYSLAKDISVFNETNFKVEIFHNNTPEPITVKNELRYKFIDIEHSWDFPKRIDKLDYEFENKIKGKLIAAKNVVAARMNGIALFSRGKLVNDYSFLDVNASSHDYKYITGWLDIDFIDLWDKEVISTNRRSLNWEYEETTLLKQYLEQLYRYFFNEVKDVKQKNKVKEVETVTGVSIQSWIDGLPPHEKKLADKLVKIIINHGGIETVKAGELVSFVKDSFYYESFKELATEMSEENVNSDKLIEFFKEWKIIEAREFYKLSIVRVETIKNFEKHIKENAKEVPIMHDFLVKFSWLLDPRLLNFKDEVTYSNLLKEHFKDDKLPDESDRRIDFLCHHFGESFFIIELKRPEKVISNAELDQALSYVAFIRERLGNEYGNNIYCYLIGKRLADTAEVKLKADSYRQSGTVYFKPYDALLSSAINYHQEFIDRYESIEGGKVI
jgi:hypothetical protein